MGHKKSGKIGEKLVFEISRMWTYFSFLCIIKIKSRKEKGMPKFIDLTGQTFDRLVVECLQEKRTSGKRERFYWKCKCKCGNVVLVRTDCLTSGLVRSCGCIKKEQDRINLTKNHRHKMSGTRLYHEWVTMKQRCINPKNKRYADYGGRGIKVCDEWLNKPDDFFKWALENGYKDNLTIDRINNNGNYEPSNCRWTDIKTQCRNRRNNILVEYQGKMITLVELSEITGINYGCLNARYRRGERGDYLIRPKKQVNTEVNA